MDLPQYQLKAEKSLMVFEFISEGTKGRIPKLVKYSDTNLKDLYNLAFGDKDIKTGIIDDSIISNNVDSEKVLATVVATIYAFTDRYPDAWIYATGSTKSRTRLYRIGISKYMEEVKQNFEVLGLKNRGWHPFKRDEDYEAFLVR